MSDDYNPHFSLRYYIFTSPVNPDESLSRSVMFKGDRQERQL
ncbi:hypothetical protein [Metallosphaera yellowstonensis]|nr:hypothetical protein [Metallosphaera yellowstonensis]